MKQNFTAIQICKDIRFFTLKKVHVEYINLCIFLCIFILQEENRARDLFYALWVPNLFMKRVEGNKDWSLFCPSEAPGLADCWGEEFEKLYAQYEEEVKLTLYLIS